MLSAHAKELIAKIGLEATPVAVKFVHNIPEGYECNEKPYMICQYIKEVQTTGKSFYVDIATKPCVGKCVVGAEPFEGEVRAGLIGWECGLYRSAAANAHFYHEIKTLSPGACNYVVYAPVADCEFDPDLIVFVAPIEQAFIIMRATSWVTGDLWESKSTMVLSCAWMYSYPFVSGKVNFMPTGMYYGQRILKAFDPGQLIISVPFQKIDELIHGLDEMDWELLALREDEESKATEKEVLKQVDALVDKTIPLNISTRLYEIEK